MCSRFQCEQGSFDYIYKQSESISASNLNNEDTLLLTSSLRMVVVHAQHFGQLQQGVNVVWCVVVQVGQRTGIVRVHGAPELLLYHFVLFRMTVLEDVYVLSVYFLH